MMDAHPWLAREKAELTSLLHLPGMDTRKLRELLSLFGSPAGAWEAVRTGAADTSSGPAAGWSAAAAGIDPPRLMASLASRGTEVAARGEDAYPGLLSAIHDPPFAIFYKGHIPFGVPGVAIVGARKATSYGVEVAGWLAGELARAGICIVSGAAYGIDSAAHRGALAAGGVTVAVLGCGVDIVYPRTSARLFREIEASGCLVSEYAPGTQPMPFRFPERNRIITGMSVAVVVVEAAEKSGALITAEFALEQGRDVLAVPGQVFSNNSRGTHNLIRAGAAIATCPQDILEEIGIDDAPGARQATAHLTLAPDEKKLMDALACGPSDVECLSLAAGLPARAAIALLGSLEVKGLVKREAGGRYQACVG